MLRDPKWRVLWLTLAVTCSMGWLFKGHCLVGGWTGAEQYTTGCYSDVVPFWFGRGVAQGQLPYFQARMEYPVLTGAQIWIEGAIARLLFGRGALDAHFLGVVTIVNALFAGLILWMMIRMGVERRRLWLWAAAPPLVLYVGHNWDLAAAALAVAALMFAWRGRLVRAATAAGLGTAAKLFPVLALPLIGLSALFGDTRPWSQRLVRATALSVAAIGAWVLVNLPVALFAPDNWSEFYRFSQERSGTAAATWDVLANMGVLLTWVQDRNLYATVLFVGGSAAMIGLGWRRHRAHLWVLFAPVLAWFMLTNKVYSPQFDLWLYPVIVLLAPRLWPVLWFAAADLAAYFAEFWWLAGMEGAWPSATPTAIAFAATFRAAAMLWIIVDCVRRDAPGWVTAPQR
ncbi:hypothetical protein ACG3SL_20390 [Sphingomonas sp. CJ20]